MFDNPSLTTRIAIGKGIGFLFGLAGFLLLPSFLPDAGWLIRWGILLWYTTVGAIIGVFGVWMNFVLTFFAYDTMAVMLVAIFGEDGIIQSPFWFTVEGAIIGMVIGYFATRLGGEGPETVER